MNSIQTVTGIPPVVLIVIALLVRLLKSDTKIPIDIPARWQPLAALAFGQLYAIGQSILSGTDWKTALITGLKAAVWTMGAYDILIKAIFNGNDAPWWLKWLIRPEAQIAKSSTPNQMS
jgi:hypothetical protein